MQDAPHGRRRSYAARCSSGKDEIRPPRACAIRVQATKRHRARGCRWAVPIHLHTTKRWTLALTICSGIRPRSPMPNRARRAI